MNRFSILALFFGSLLSLPAAGFAQPAPAEKGLAGDGPEVVQLDNQPPEGKEKSTTASSKTDVAKTLEQQIADLQTEIEALRTVQKDMEALQGRINILEGENTALANRVKTLESTKDALDKRVASLEADNATLQENLAKMPVPGNDATGERTTAKPAFTYAAVRFHNNEGHSLRMNVNGVWHTLKPGENDIWVPHGPVHIYRYTDSEPKLFWEWKPYKNGYLMEFDVGTKTEEKT